MNSILTSILKAIGPSTLLPIVEAELLSQAANMGEASLERAISLPQSALAALCSKTGANVDTAVALQQIAAQHEADFLLYVATGRQAD